MWTRHVWAKSSPGPQEAVLSGGVGLVSRFTDPKGRLQTAYDDLRQFLSAGGVSSENGAYVIETGYVPNLGDETFRVEVGKQACRILAADTEGIRRGIFYIEDEMLRRRGPHQSDSSSFHPPPHFTLFFRSHQAAPKDAR